MMTEAAVLVPEDDVCPAYDPETSAENAGLVYVSDDKPGITRRKAGSGFAYRSSKGEAIRDPKILERIRSLAIPPAYTDVWICPKANGHIQATGRDAKGRKQYRYHPRWHEVRGEAKYERLIEFGEHLPEIRTRIDEDLSKRGLTRDKVLATVVQLLDTTLIRIGNERYRRDNKSFGLTTLRNRHVEAGSDRLRFSFKGKSGKDWKLTVKDRRIARIVRQCQDVPGQHLFQYFDADGTPHPVDSHDVNAYIRDVLGQGFSAKHFRTWAGTVTAAHALHQAGGFTSKAEGNRKLNKAVDVVADRLVNTRAISRRCYIHSGVIESYLEGRFEDEFARAEEEAAAIEGLPPEEALVLALLKTQARELKEG
ncbi:DNA topoisomerase IB [Terrihabitans rhizophilus]|uniref:DNA topoisomerase n=1 Tax=Terrihabitans rhizophilus TaxID=3092662 RepID=A0ABU4RIK5_9HYPH|nr:DNA topoisomerase IB [Terrihabitans sp. PJ23]MDX6804668.1 DNA topoisomerase IB [Terrihabitans sp. PJ23]